MFETGNNRWRRFQQWPPNHVGKTNIYLQEDDGLSFDQPTETNHKYP